MSIIFSIIFSIFQFLNDNLDCIKYLITTAIDFMAFPYCRVYRTRFACGVILIAACIILNFFTIFSCTGAT